MDDRKQQDGRRDGGRTAPAAGTAPEPADERPWELPEYLHERELGAGASGRVVLARHRATGTPVAVKYLHRAAGTAALRAEAEVLAGLDSPHVTRLYEYVEGERGAAIVMELVDGIALRDLLRAEGATTPEAALVVLKGSLLGLAAAHGAGVVHRDYKPANVLVDTAGTSKLVDFGIAVPSGDERDVSGTPAYMPPEQWAGRPASPAGDVYAATVTFFECLTGARPYGGTTFAELAVQHTEAPIPAELTPDPVRPLILSGLAKDPGERPDSATALLVELEAVAAAGYGAGWEEKGRLDLTALVALLALLLPGAGGAAAGTSLAHTALGGGSSALDSSAGASSATGPVSGTGAAPAVVVRETLIRRAARTGTRGKALTGVAAGALTLATLAGMAIAGAVDGDSRTVVGGVAPEATTSIGPFDPAGAASPVASAAATEGPDTPSPEPSDPSATPAPDAPDASPSGAPTSGPPSPGAPSSPGGRSTGPAAAPTGRTSPGTPTGPGTVRPPLPPGSAVPSSGPAATGSVPPPAPPVTVPSTAPDVAPSSATPAGPGSTPPSPTLTAAPTRTVAPTIAVSSVNLDALSCAGRWSTTATVTVVAQGAATGTLTLTWFHTLGERTVDVATDTVAVHDGRATVSRTHDFTSADTFPTWGVRIGTAPAAARPGRTSDTVAAFLCDPPR
ncbi:protein kinase [Kitasatospora sp. NPDC094019]|uniref:serine/threonine-protein kinase n=1 Tax=Kitasatospora sp. NPDC094019 TaxID=3364091 RepID=UPI003812FF05